MQVNDADETKRKADSVDTTPTVDKSADPTQVDRFSACIQLALCYNVRRNCQSTCKLTSLHACNGMHPYQWR
jgi:hypothetical protein